MSRTFRDRQQALNPSFPNTQRHGFNLALTKHMTTWSTSTLTATQSSTTLAPIEPIGFRIDDFQPNTTHVITGNWNLSIANAAHNIKFDLNGGTMTALSVAGTAKFTLANGTNLVVPITALNTSVDGSTTNAWIAIEWNLLLVVATPGSLVPQFAQSASGASNSSITSAYLRAVNLA